MPALWHAPTTAARDRKRLLRTLMADVTPLPEPDLGKARIGIRWHTGATDELVVTRRLSVVEFRRTDPAAIELARRHAHLSNRDLAEQLNAAGYTTGVGRRFDAAAVANLRHYHQLPSPGLLRDGEVTVAEVARRLGIGHGAVIHWIHREWLPARRGLDNQYCVPFGPDVENACRERVAASVHLPGVDDPAPATDDERTVGQAAAALGIRTNVVYYWIEHGHVDARRGPGGRWLIPFTRDVEAACRRRVAGSVRIKPVAQPQTPRSTSEERGLVNGRKANGGREWQLRGRPERVDVHDFPDPDVPKAIPYGVYDVGADEGWMSVGDDHDTAAFAVNAIRRWWQTMGRDRYPQATRLLVTADPGGFNGYRNRLWKTELAKLAAETGLAITVCHYPPGTSKWNTVEHRFFSFITKNWRGRPLTSYRVIVELAAATTTETGLRVLAEWDQGYYPTGTNITDAQLAALLLTRHDRHPQWNYNLDPPAEPETTHK